MLTPEQNVRISRCGSCGKVGHNRRTCGGERKNRAMKGSGNKAVTAQRNTPAPLTRRNLVNKWDEFLAKKSNTDGAGTPIGEHPTDEVYTFEELQTLWMLKSGKTGKAKENSGSERWASEDDKKLLEFVQSFDFSKNNMPAKVWYKFFKGFGASPKENLLSRFKPSENYIKTQTALDFLTGNSDEKPEGAPELPKVLYPVFAKDPSMYVRAGVAEKAGMPAVVREILVDDKKVIVVAMLAQSWETPGEVLEKIERRMKLGTPHSFEELEKNLWRQRSEQVIMRTHIAKNPNITERLIRLYSTSQSCLASRDIQMGLYSNPAVPDGEVWKHYRARTAELKEINEKIRTTEISAGEKGAGQVNGAREKEPSESAEQRVVVLKNHGKYLINAVNAMVVSGKLPREETLLNINTMVDNATGIVHQWRESKQIKVTVQRCQKFTEEDFGDLFEKFKEKELVYSMQGLASNPQVPQHVLRSIVRWAERRSAKDPNDLAARNLFRYSAEKLNNTPA